MGLTEQCQRLYWKVMKRLALEIFKIAWTWSWAPFSRFPCLSKGVGPFCGYGRIHVTVARFLGCMKETVYFSQAQWVRRSDALANFTFTLLLRDAEFCFIEHLVPHSKTSLLSFVFHFIVMPSTTVDILSCVLHQGLELQSFGQFCNSQLALFVNLCYCWKTRYRQKCIK